MTTGYVDRGEPTPTGPQLNDADLPAMTEADLISLATAVGMELSTCEFMFDDGDIDREELRWVQSDAERVRSELMRRGLWTEEGLLHWLPPSIRKLAGEGN